MGRMFKSNFYHRITRRRRGAPWAVTAFYLGLLLPGIPATCRTLLAKSSPDRTTTAGSVSFVRLGPIWRDDADGFEIRPPSGCQGMGRTGMDLASFANHSQRWGLIVHLALLTKPAKLAPLAQATIQQARHDFQHVRVLEQKRMKVSGRPAQKLVIRFQAISNHAPILLLRQQLLVQAGPSRYYVLTFFSPSSQRTMVIPVFDTVIGSFRLLNRKKIERERTKAIAAGKKWLARQSARILLAHANLHPRLFRIMVRHHNIGYVRTHTYIGRQDGFQGVFFGANSRIFLSKGTVIMAKSICFWAFRRQPGISGSAVHFNAWVKSMETLMPINNPRIVALRQERLVLDPKTRSFHLVHTAIPWPNMEVHWTTELGTQQRGLFPVADARGKTSDVFTSLCRIHVIRQSGHVVAGQSNKPLRFSIRSGMPAVLPPALQFLWPRLVNLHKRQTLAFVVFDSRTLRLGLRVLQVLGPEKISVGSRRMTAYHLVDQLDPGVSNLWVNSRGGLLKVDNPDGSAWLPTTVGAMKKRWAIRLAALQQK